MNTLRVIIQIAGWVGMALAAAGGQTNETIYCLTGNATNAALNLPGVNGSYTYGLANCLKAYNQGDDNGFPMAYIWTSGPDCHTNGAPDAGGTNGWIPFEKGTLTSGKGFIAWPSDAFKSSAKRLPIIRDIIFDLQKEYWIGGVEMDTRIDDNAKYFGNSWRNMSIYVLPANGDRYMLAGRYRGYGLLQQPSFSNNTLTVQGLDSVTRFIRVRIETSAGDWYRNTKNGSPPVFAIRIWGQSADGRAGVKPFEYARGATELDLPILEQNILPQYPFVFPYPKEIKFSGESFALKAGAPCYIQGLSRETMERFVRELWEKFGVKLELTSRAAMEKTTANAIVIGICQDELIGQLTRQHGPAVTPESPGRQGYFMLVTNNLILVSGSDALGAYYGLQNIFQLAHWQRQGDGYVPVVDGVRMLDWPDEPDRKWARTRNSGPNRIEDPEGLRTYLAIKTRYKQGTYLYFPNPECTALAPYHPENPAQNDTGLIVKDGIEYYPTEKWGFISKAYIDRARYVAATYLFEYRPYRVPLEDNALIKRLKKPYQYDVTLFTYSKDGHTTGGPDMFACGPYCALASYVLPCLLETARSWNKASWDSLKSTERGRELGVIKERLYEMLIEREKPCLMRGRQCAYFQVDLTPYANLSRVDEKAGDGHGWMDFGPHYDLRNLPTGQVAFCGEIPFTIPGRTNQEELTAVAIAAPNEASMRYGDFPSEIEVPLDRKAASLNILGTSFQRMLNWACLESGTTTNKGASADGRFKVDQLLYALRTAQLWLPCCRILYTDGTYEIIPAEAKWIRPWVAYHRKTPSVVKYAGIKTDFMTELSDRARMAWRGFTEAGDEVDLYMQEWVNPYPEKQIQSVKLYFPTDLKGDFTYALLAITGVRPDRIDAGIWERKGKPDLHRVVDLTVPEGKQGRNVFGADCVVKETAKGAYECYDSAGAKLAEINRGGFTEGQAWHDGYFPFTWPAFLTEARNLAALTDPKGLQGAGELSRPLEIRFQKGRRLARIAVRGMMENAPFLTGGATQYGFMKADVKVEVSGDGKAFQTIKELKGIFGEEGIFQVILDGKPVKAVRVWLDARPYAGTYDYYAFYPGLTHLGIYEQ